MSQEKLINLLDIFKRSRENLSLDFIEENPEIFKPMFQYENNKELMELSIEKYLVEYIDHHFEIFKEYDDLDKEFSEAMMVFIKKFQVSVSNKDLHESEDLFFNLLTQKQNFLSNMINVAKKDTNRYTKLLYAYEKDKALFDRTIRNIEEEENE